MTLYGSLSVVFFMFLEIIGLTSKLTTFWFLAHFFNVQKHDMNTNLYCASLLQSRQLQNMGTVRTFTEHSPYIKYRVNNLVYAKKKSS